MKKYVMSDEHDRVCEAYGLCVPLALGQHDRAWWPHDRAHLSGVRKPDFSCFCDL